MQDKKYFGEIEPGKVIQFNELSTYCGHSRIFRSPVLQIITIMRFAFDIVQFRKPLQKEMTTKMFLKVYLSLFFSACIQVYGLRHNLHQT